MILRACQDFDIDLVHSWFVGDKLSDINAGLAAIVKLILVLTGYGTKERSLIGLDITCAENVLEASTLIVSKVS